MMLGGLSDGCGELRAGLRQPSGIPRLLCGLLRPQAVAGSQRELPSGAANAENLSESVGISARAMQRFLTEARWSDETVIGRLQEYLAPRLRHPEAVWVFDGSVPQAGQVGGSGPAVLRQAGQGGQLPGWDVPGLRQPAGPGVGGQAAVSAQELDLRPGPVCCGGCAGGPAELPVTELALEMLERVLELGYLRAEWVAGDDAFGMSPTFREGLAALGMRYVLDVPGGTTVWPLDPAWTSPEYPGFGRPRKPKLRPGQRRTMEQRGDELPDEAWREITVAQGSQGPRTYRFSAQRVRATRRRKPGEELWAVWRRNLDGSEPRYYLSNAPEGTTLETLAYVGGSRWRIETEFETEKGDVGLDEYETRSWAGWHHHIAMCLLGGAFLLSLQQDWGGKDAPDHEATGVPGGAGDAAPGAVGPDQLLLWLEDTQLQRTGSPFPRETPLHPPRKQDGAATLNPSL